MDLRHSILLLAMATLVYCQRGMDERGYSYVHVLGKFTCQGKPAEGAYVEIREADPIRDDIFKQTKLDKNGVIDYLVYGEDSKFFLNDDGMEVYVKVWYDCGCPRVYSTPFAPQHRFYADEIAAVDHPWKFEFDIYDEQECG